MKKILINFQVFGLLLALLCSLLFVGCGEKRSQEEISKVYASVLADYEGVFFSGGGKDVSINYSDKIESKINNATEDSLFHNLKSKGVGAIFEPVLRADLKAVDYFIYWELDYSKVPTDLLNSVFNDAKNFRSSLKTLQETKTMLEDASNPENWVGEYRTKLYNTMCYYNAFTEKYLTIFEKYVNADTSQKGRVSTSQMQLDYSKKLLESAKIITMTVAKDYLKEAYTETEENCCNKMNKLFYTAVQIYETDDFHNVIISSKTEKEDDLIMFQNKINNYTLYQNNFKAVENILKNHSRKEMKNKQLNSLSSKEEDAYLSKIDEFLNQDVKVMFDDYMLNLTYALEEWRDANNTVGD
ncbi:MAG: hypothetical protein IJ837_04625 [Clostridia bacterium]|nr:hypothetical protein [Clostridia bacterium]